MCGELSELPVLRCILPYTGYGIQSQQLEQVRKRKAMKDFHMSERAGLKIQNSSEYMQHINSTYQSFSVIITFWVVWVKLEKKRIQILSQ